MSDQRVERIFKPLEKAIFLVALAGGMLVVVLTWFLFLGAIARYALRSPIGQTVEIGSLMFLVLSLLGMGYTLQVGGHINFSLVEDRLTGKPKHVLQVISAVVCFVIFILLTIGGWGTFSNSLVSDWRTADMNLPWASVQWVLPLGFGLLLLEGLLLLVRRILLLKARS